MIRALRPSGIFGEWDTLMVPTTVRNAQKGKMKYIIGSGRNEMDWTYAGNVAQVGRRAGGAAEWWLLLCCCCRPNGSAMCLGGEVAFASGVLCTIVSGSCTPGNLPACPP